MAETITATLTEAGETITVYLNEYTAPGATGASTFLALTDTPSSYSGQAGKSVRVNTGATALEFFTPDAASSITGLIEAGTNVTLDGEGVTGDPYVINATGGGTPPTPVFFDDFGREDTSSNAIGNATSGQAWVINGAGAASARILQGRLDRVSPRGTIYCYPTIAFAPRVWGTRFSIVANEGGTTAAFLAMIMTTVDNGLTPNMLHIVWNQEQIGIEYWYVDSSDSETYLTYEYLMPLRTDGTIYAMMFEFFPERDEMLFYPPDGAGPITVSIPDLADKMTQHICYEIGGGDTGIWYGRFEDGFAIPFTETRDDWSGHAAAYAAAQTRLPGILDQTTGQVSSRFLPNAVEPLMPRGFFRIPVEYGGVTVVTGGTANLSNGWRRQTTSAASGASVLWRPNSATFIQFSRGVSGFGVQFTHQVSFAWGGLMHLPSASHTLRFQLGRGNSDTSIADLASVGIGLILTGGEVFIEAYGASGRVVSDALATYTYAAQNMSFLLRSYLGTVHLWLNDVYVGSLEGGPTSGSSGSNAGPHISLENGASPVSAYVDHNPTTMVVSVERTGSLATPTNSSPAVFFDGDKGDVTVSSDGTVWELNPTEVTPGTYTLTSITVDAKGRITAISSGSSGGGDALTSSNLGQFADVTQTSGQTLAITASTTLNGGTHSGTNTGDQTDITGNAGTVTSIGNLTGVVTSTNRATAIADGALSIAKTSGLQTALDGKLTSADVDTANTPSKIVARDGSGVINVGLVNATGGQSVFSSTQTTGVTEYGNSATWTYGTGRAAVHRTALEMETISQAEAEAGTSTTTRAFTAQRIAQAISALGGGGSASADVQVFTSSGTWTKPANASYCDIIVIAGGGAGGSGRRGAEGTVRGGGGGGGAAGMTTFRAPASFLSSSETITVGAGGTGGENAGDDTNGSPGSAGGNSSIGSKVVTTGGNFGGGGSTSGGAAGAQIASAVHYIPRDINNAPAGGAGSSTSAAGGTGSSLVTGPSGGGGGNSRPADNSTPNAGAGGAIGTFGGPIFTNGGNAGGTAGASGATSQVLGTGSGGQGGRQLTGLGIPGGRGGDYGGGGGGGSAAANGLGGSTAGGNGGDGIVVIITYLDP